MVQHFSHDPLKEADTISGFLVSFTIFVRNVNRQAAGAYGDKVLPNGNSTLRW